MISMIKRSEQESSESLLGRAKVLASLALLLNIQRSRGIPPQLGLVILTIWPLALIT